MVTQTNKTIISENIELVKDFKKALNQFFLYCSADTQKIFYIDSYKNKRVKSVKILDICLEENEPILICAVKNDIERIKEQVKYHRKMGIKHFAYIDNMSTDGTFEWLYKQNDVSLFRVNEKFNATVKCAWRRQVTDVFGYERWYLIVDSDEFFMYPDIENRTIDKYISYLEKEKIRCVFSPMIDMYSKNCIFGNSSEEKIMEKYKYFDTNTYKKFLTLSRQSIVGGSRSRLFSKNNYKFSCCLSKYSLIKASKSMVIGTHENFPKKFNFETSGAIAFLLHYKFLSSDILKYEEIIKVGNYFSGSSEYKHYMKIYRENTNLSFYHEDSQQLNNSMDLMKINVIDKKFFKKYLKS